MNKKLLEHCTSRNITFGILTIFAMISFIIEIHNALFDIKVGAVLNYVQYTIFALKISVTLGTYTHVSNIFIYPLIPIIGGIIYNIVIIIISHTQKE